MAWAWRIGHTIQGAWCRGLCPSVLPLQPLGVVWEAAGRALKTVPNQSAQPMPEDRCGFNREPATRHGWLQRWPVEAPDDGRTASVETAEVNPQITAVGAGGSRRFRVRPPLAVRVSHLRHQPDDRHECGCIRYGSAPCLCRHAFIGMQLGSFAPEQGQHRAVKCQTNTGGKQS